MKSKCYAAMACGALLASSSPLLLAADKLPPIPPRSHAEHLTYDPATDTWRESAAPVPGTEDGDLDLARQWLARQDYGMVLKITKPWIKQYGKTAPRYPEALYLQGTAQLELGEYRDADDTFQKILNDAPGSDYAEPALSARFRIAEQYLAGKRRKALWGLLRVTDREGGVKIMDDVTANYADTPLAEMAARSKGDYYFARGDFDQAQQEYDSFVRAYPRSRWHPRALLQSARAALASFPGVQFDDAALLEARERFTQFSMQYPDIAREQNVAVLLDEIAARRADKTFEIGRVYEKYRQPKAARYYYRETAARWPDTAAAAQARIRLEALGEPLAEGAG